MTQVHTHQWFSHWWRPFCKMVVKVFYRRFEIDGLEKLPENTGLIICANHANALADVVIIQASSNRQLRPLARSGLFSNVFLKPVLVMIGAVPIFRPGDKGSDVGKNQGSFQRVFEILAANEALIIFPEGQSHSDPQLRQIKSGLTRMALGAMDANGAAPVIVPVGLTFSRKGTFRSDVLVQYGTPIDLTVPHDLNKGQERKLISQRIQEGLADVTLNADTWEEIDLVDRLEKFFAFRHGKYRQRSLSHRFRALQRLIKAQHLLKEKEPEKVRALVNHLKMFERLRQCCGINDYQLSIHYQPMIIFYFIIRMLIVLFIGLPIALWCFINGYIPYYLTSALAKKTAKGRDQFDTSSMTIGLILFTLFWFVQTIIIYAYFGSMWAVIYFLSLLISTIVALSLRGEYQRIFDNLKVFFMLMRKKGLKKFLKDKRREIEVELAALAKIARRLSNEEKTH